jgi:hypothetical protein
LKRLLKKYVALLIAVTMLVGLNITAAHAAIVIDTASPNSFIIREEPTDTVPLVEALIEAQRIRAAYPNANITIEMTKNITTGAAITLPTGVTLDGLGKTVTGSTIITTAHSSIPNVIKDVTFVGSRVEAYGDIEIGRCGFSGGAQIRILEQGVDRDVTIKGNDFDIPVSGPWPIFIGANVEANINIDDNVFSASPNYSEAIINAIATSSSITFSNNDLTGMPDPDEDGEVYVVNANNRRDIDVKGSGNFITVDTFTGPQTVFLDLYEKRRGEWYARGESLVRVEIAIFYEDKEPPNEIIRQWTWIPREALASANALNNYYRNEMVYRLNNSPVTGTNIRLGEQVIINGKLNTISGFAPLYGFDGIVLSPGGWHILKYNAVYTPVQFEEIEVIIYRNGVALAPTIIKEVYPHVVATPEIANVFYRNALVEEIVSGKYTYVVDGVTYNLTNVTPRENYWYHLNAAGQKVFVFDGTFVKAGDTGDNLAILDLSEKYDGYLDFSFASVLNKGFKVYVPQAEGKEDSISITVLEYAYRYSARDSRPSTTNFATFAAADLEDLGDGYFKVTPRAGFFNNTGGYVYSFTVSVDEGEATNVLFMLNP